MYLAGGVAKRAGERMMDDPQGDLSTHHTRGPTNHLLCVLVGLKILHQGPKACKVFP